MTTFRERVRDEIENTTELVGVTGVYTYSPTDHVGLDERAVTTIEIRDGSFVRAGEEASGG
jgi:branched-chain amino acid transport system substrate-binding protein